MAMRGTSDRPPGPLRRAVVGLIAAPWLLALVWPMVLIVIGAVAWQKYGGERATRQFVGVEPDQITITRPPPHIRTDVTAAVFRDTAMETLSLLEPTATAKIASAYSIHPWVEDVTRVRKLPGGGVDVHLKYRDVAAMVKVFKPGVGGGTASRVPHFFPVDRNGVLLPSQDFSGAQTVDYIHIDIPGVYTSAATGAGFGEPRVEMAAGLAWLLHPHRESVGIEAITVFGNARRQVIPQYEIRLRDGETLFWGSPPGREPAGEATAEAKLRWMLSPARGRDDDLRWAGRASTRR